MDEVSFSGLVIILTLQLLVPQYWTCNSCEVTLMKTTAYIGIFWEVLMLHPSILVAFMYHNPAVFTLSALISALLPMSQAAESLAVEDAVWSSSFPLVLRAPFSQTAAGRWMSQEPEGWAPFPALRVSFLARAQALPVLVPWLVTMHLTCLLSSPGFWVYVLSSLFAVMQLSKNLL